MTWLQQLVQPDMLRNDQVINALQAGAVVAIVSALLGFFVVLRGLAFAGHAITDIGFTGAAGAVLAGVHPLWGMLSCCVVAAVGIDLLGERARERDVATGVVLALALGLGALFLSVSTRFVSTPSALLFGSIFSVEPALTGVMTLIGGLCLLVLAVLYRPLMFCSVAPQAAAARGVPVQLIGVVFLIVMAVAVAEAAQVVGVLLSTALLIGPAATATYLTHRAGLALLLAAVVGVLETWLGIVLAYDSYGWPPGGKGWPVSFFITILALGVYLLARLARPAERRPAYTPSRPAPADA